MKTICPCSEPLRCTIRSPASRSTSATATRYPSRAKASTAASPIPCAPPDTMATFPVSIPSLVPISRETTMQSSDGHRMAAYMKNETRRTSSVGRRTFLTAGASAAAGTVLAQSAFGQPQGFSIGPEPIRYPSTVWKVLDERFRKYMIGNTPLVREWTGSMWAEGPAWNGVGRYVVFSDIPNNVQMRWDEATGKVTQLRAPANFSNGNTFDYQGRQISCEHQTARVVRYEYQGEPTVLASTFEGKRLNAPNDAIVHPNGGGILFTDPGYGSHWYYEGTVRELELPTSVYHIDAQTSRLTKLTDEIFKPNGLCFSPDYRFVYVADTAPTHHPKEKAKLIR